MPARNMAPMKEISLNPVVAADVAVKQEPVKVAPKIGRNDPCPCGSGKKYKHCHGKDA